MPVGFALGKPVVRSALRAYLPRTPDPVSARNFRWVVGSLVGFALGKPVVRSALRAYLPRKPGPVSAQNFRWVVGSLVGFALWKPVVRSALRAPQGHPLQLWTRQVAWDDPVVEPTLRLASRSLRPPLTPGHCWVAPAMGMIIPPGQPHTFRVHPRKLLARDHPGGQGLGLW